MILSADHRAATSSKKKENQQDVRPSAHHWRGRGGCHSLLIAPIVSLWIIGALCVKDVPVVHVVALVGEPTYLPCDISSNLEGDAVELILWFREDRDGSSSSIYSVDARERDINFAECWSDEKVFSNRAKFIQEKNPAELGVDHIREDEAGIYRCRVEFRVGPIRNSKVNLTVIDINKASNFIRTKSSTSSSTSIWSSSASSVCDGNEQS